MAVVPLNPQTDIAQKLSGDNLVTLRIAQNTLSIHMLWFTFGMIVMAWLTIFVFPRLNF